MGTSSNGMGSTPSRPHIRADVADEARGDLAPASGDVAAQRDGEGGAHFQDLGQQRVVDAGVVGGRDGDDGGRQAPAEILGHLGAVVIE